MTQGFGIAVLLYSSVVGFASQVPEIYGWTPATSLGMVAYARGEQSADQQLRDEMDCYSFAQQETGFDPQARPPAPLIRQHQKLPIKDAGNHPAAPATKDQQQSQAAQRKQTSPQANQMRQEPTIQTAGQDRFSLQTFRRVFSLCMDGRGYSVY